MVPEIVKNTRVETRENRNGRIQERTVTTWDLVVDGTILAEFTRKSDAVAEFTELITLPNGVLAKPCSVKCYRPGCRRTKHGYLTIHRSHLGGGAFYDKRGNLLADLREVNFACPEHGIADGSAPFLYEDKE